VQLHNARKQFEEKELKVVLVGLGSAEQAEKFRAEFSLTFPIICDPQKELYRQYGLGRGGVSSLASPAVLLRGMRAMSRGFTPGIPQGDVMQMPGVFLIDTEGNIRYSYYSKDASDHPPVNTLLALKNTAAKIPPPEHGQD
jgi:peroxiredoxin